MWDLPCVLQASCLEGGPLLWIWPLYLHVNQNPIMMMMVIMVMMTGLNFILNKIILTEFSLS